MNNKKIVFIANSNESVSSLFQEEGLDVEICLRTGNVNEDVAKIHPDILICRNRDDISEIIKTNPCIRMVFIVEVGLERLPFKELQARNIRVANTSGISADIMSNYVLACILDHVVKLGEDILNQRNSYWKRFQSTDSLDGKTLLIVGAGRTGIQIAHKARPFGLNIVGIVRNQREIEGFNEIGTFCQINQYLSKADYVVCTLPLTSETQAFFSIEKYRKMKPTSIFINVSRGGLVNECDLVDALDSGMVAHAYLDVFSIEPLPEDHVFWKHEKITVTPHQSGRLVNNIDVAMKMFIQNYRAYCAGNIMPNEVNLQQGY